MLEYFLSNISCLHRPIQLLPISFITFNRTFRRVVSIYTRPSPFPSLTFSTLHQAFSPTIPPNLEPMTSMLLKIWASSQGPIPQHITLSTAFLGLLLNLESGQDTPRPKPTPHGFISHWDKFKVLTMAHRQGMADPHLPHLSSDLTLSIRSLVSVPLDAHHVSPNPRPCPCCSLCL